MPKKPNYNFEKRQKELARQQKKENKRQERLDRKQERSGERDEGQPEPAALPENNAQ